MVCQCKHLFLQWEREKEIDIQHLGDDPGELRGDDARYKYMCTVLVAPYRSGARSDERNCNHGFTGVAHTLERAQLCNHGVLCLLYIGRTEVDSPGARLNRKP